MPDWLLSIVLGIIEGLTEFLPVSSTAHLRISEAIFGVDLSSAYWKMYSIVIQLGRHPVRDRLLLAADHGVCAHLSQGRTAATAPSSPTR